mgnify:CR=1 FL=1
MAKSKKLSKEHLDILQGKVNVINQTQMQIGNLEFQKSTVVQKSKDLQADLQMFQQELEEKYGKVTIDIATGEYKKIEEQPK